jgi:hypothetical protein
MQELGLKNPMQVPRIEKITVNMGVGEAVADKKLIDNAAGDLAEDHRPEAADLQVEEVARDVQAARRAADRREGHAARRPHVRVPRPPDQRSRCRASATSAACRRVPSTAAATTTSA